MCMEFWHEYIARTLQVRRCTAPFSRLMVGTLARSGGRLGGIHTAVVTRGATLSFCSFGHGTASDPVNVTNAVAGAGAEAADRAIVQIKEALHGALSGIICDWRFWTRPVSGGFVQYLRNLSRVRNALEGCLLRSGSARYLARNLRGKGSPTSNTYLLFKSPRRTVTKQ
jgi:hypothetical protein